MRVRAALVLATVVAVLWPAAPASAHVLLAKAQPNGDGTTTLTFTFTFTFDHGCGESPTTGLAVSMADGVIAGSAVQPPGWAGQVVPSRVHWTGPGIGADVAAEFSVVARISGSVGQTLWFPTEQRCVNDDSYNWVGTDPGDEEPAPSLIATGAILAPAPSADRRREPAAPELARWLPVSSRRCCWPPPRVSRLPGGDRDGTEHGNSSHTPRPRPAL